MMHDVAQNSYAHPKKTWVQKIILLHLVISFCIVLHAHSLNLMLHVFQTQFTAHERWNKSNQFLLFVKAWLFILACLVVYDTFLYLNGATFVFKLLIFSCISTFDTWSFAFAVLLIMFLLSWVNNLSNFLQTENFWHVVALADVMLLKKISTEQNSRRYRRNTFDDVMSTSIEFKLMAEKDL